MSRVRPATNFAFGVVRNNEFHLTPVHATMQMRPCFQHIDDAKVRACTCGTAAEHACPLCCYPPRVPTTPTTFCFVQHDKVRLSSARFVFCCICVVGGSAGLDARAHQGWLQATRVSGEVCFHFKLRCVFERRALAARTGAVVCRAIAADPSRGVPLQAKISRLLALRHACRPSACIA